MEGAKILSFPGEDNSKNLTEITNIMKTLWHVLPTSVKVDCKKEYNNYQIELKKTLNNKDVDDFQTLRLRYINSLKTLNKIKILLRKISNSLIARGYTIK